MFSQLGRKENKSDFLPRLIKNKNNNNNNKTTHVSQFIFLGHTIPTVEEEVRQGILGAQFCTRASVENPLSTD